MPYMLIRESDRLEDLMSRTGGYGTTGYDPAKPWDFLWKLAADNNESQKSRWWYREFERKTPIVLDKGIGRFIEGDARVAATPRDHFATTHNAVHASAQDRGGVAYGNSGGNDTKRGGGGGGRSSACSKDVCARC